MFWELWHNGGCAGYKVKILTGDRDLFQLIDPQKEVSVLYLSSAFIQRGGTGPTQVGLEQVKEKLGISQVVDYKALWDKSDNILGVKGALRKQRWICSVQHPRRYLCLAGSDQGSYSQKLGRTLPITPAIWLNSTRCPFRC